MPEIVTHRRLFQGARIGLCVAEWRVTKIVHTDVIGPTIVVLVAAFHTECGVVREEYTDRFIGALIDVARTQGAIALWLKRVALQVGSATADTIQVVAAGIPHFGLATNQKANTQYLQ